jgi:hypothetical protein
MCNRLTWRFIALFVKAIGGRTDGKEQNEAQTGSEIDSETPDLEQSKSIVLNSLTSLSSRRTHGHAIREFIEWHCSESRLAFNQAAAIRHSPSLPSMGLAEFGNRLPAQGRSERCEAELKDSYKRRTSEGTANLPGAIDYTWEIA